MNLLAEAVAQAAAVGFVVKALIDVLKMAVDPPRWVAPLLAIGGGIGFMLLLAYGSEPDLTRAVVVRALFAGFLAGAAAIGVTQLQDRERRED